MNACRSSIPKILPLATAALLTLLSAPGPALAAPPERLRLRAEDSTVTEGESARLTVELLDARYQPVHNDRQRTVTLRQQPATENSHGRIQLDPAQLTLPAGASSASATFEGARSGRVLVEATAPGLASAQVLVSVRPRNASWLSVLASLVAAPAYADPPTTLEIFPREVDARPANGLTPARLNLLVDPAPDDGEVVRVRVEASGDARIIYRGEEGEAHVVLLESGDLQSDTLEVISATPETVRVTASVFPAGPEDEVEISFVQAVPKEIAFSPEPEELREATSRAQLELELRDQDEAPLETLAGEYPITLIPSNPDAVRIHPANLVLGPTQARGRASLELRRYPGDRVEVSARHQGDPSALGEGKKSLPIRSPVSALAVVAPNRLQGGDEEVLLLELRHGEELVQAGLPRQVEVTVSRGRIESGRGAVKRASFTIPKGQSEAEVTYHPPAWGGEVSVRATSRGLVASRTLQVATATAALLLLTAVGGLLGGVSRDLYKEGIGRILPRWVRGRLDPGLLLDAAMSALFGIVLYYAVRLGLLQGLGTLLPQDLRLDAPALAFVLGVLGGFGGVMVLERLLARIFPQGQQSPEPA